MEITCTSLSVLISHFYYFEFSGSTVGVSSVLVVEDSSHNQAAATAPARTTRTARRAPRNATDPPNAVPGVSDGDPSRKTATTSQRKVTTRETATCVPHVEAGNEATPRQALTITLLVSGPDSTVQDSRLVRVQPPGESSEPGIACGWDAATRAAVT